ncbi:hypothetical protein DFQ27_004705 [Actinomortierella ambigua]|uniref:Cytochrome P450 n=1 Tax=Actinomortierella ambigua TaxID=1343610 RepID=A0A9P6UCD7_9FUNG|nr:hypothetical protein DFQ27_004705 [Actinomortierella ambigua]
MVLNLADIQTIDQLAAFKAIVPLAVGTASVAYLATKVASNYYSSDKDIPTVALKDGATSHDEEYKKDPKAFMLRCEQEYGSVYNLHLFNQFQTVVNGPELARELFLRDDLNAGDAVEELTGMRVFFRSMTKSNHEDDSMVIHFLVRDFITPYLNLYTPRIVRNLEKQLDEHLPDCDRKLVKNPVNILQRMVACAMACVFMGEEIGVQSQVIDTFIQCTYDFNEVVGAGERSKSFWRTFRTKTKYTYMSPMAKHINVLVNAATPVILRRRKEEAEEGEAYVRPDDVMQRMLDNFDKYNFVDIEDLCGHLLVMVLASVHTTSDASTNLLYYLAQYPEYIDKLYEEMQEVLAQEAREIEELAIKDGITTDTPLITKPSDAMSAKAMKKMVYLDSFVREVFRHRTDLIGIPHMARKNLTLGNGVRIPKGRSVTVNLRSTHWEESMQGPDPLEFRPWRFVGKAKGTTKVGPDFLPFGMGKHACPGRFLAMQEIKTVACMMIGRFSKIEMEDPTKAYDSLHSMMGAPAVTGLYFTSRQ